MTRSVKTESGREPSWKIDSPKKALGPGARA